MALDKVTLKYTPDDVKLQVALEAYRDKINEIVDNINGDTSAADAAVSIQELQDLVFSYIDQDVKTTAGPTFDHIHLGANGIFTTTKARAYLNTDQLNIADTTFTKILLDTENYDPGSNFDLVNSKFVTPFAGYYQVTGQICWKNMVANKAYDAAIYVDGTIYAIGRQISGPTLLDYLTSHVSDIVYAASGKAIELYCYHSSGVATEDIQNGTIDTYLAVHLLSME